MRYKSMALACLYLMLIVSSCIHKTEEHQSTDILVSIKKLKQDNPKWTGQYMLTGSFLDLQSNKKYSSASFEIIKSNIKNISSLRGLKLTGLDLSLSNVSNLSPIKKMPLTKLNLMRTPINNEALKELKGLKLVYLDINGCRSVSNLSDIGNMPLQYLDIGFTKVTDLSPLQGMPLKVLNLQNTKISDISVLKSLKLEILILSNTNVTDLSPLQGMPLKVLSFDNKRIVGGSAINDFILNHNSIAESDAP